MRDADPVSELTRTNKELLSLYDINRLLQTQLSTEEKLYIILTSLTADDGFGYSRTYLFLANERRNTLEGWLGVGPLTGEEVREIWAGVTALEDDDSGSGRRNISELLERAPFDIGVRNFVVPIRKGQGHPVQTAVSRRPKLIRDDGRDSLHPGLAEFITSPQAAFIPLLSKRRVLGVIAVESPGGDRSIDEGRLRTLTIFGNLAAIALENSELYRALEEKVSTLERVNGELREAQARIVHLDRLASLGAIAAGVAHEIKNPLNSLALNLHLLKEELPDGGAETKKLLSVVEREASRLNDTVMEFLSYSKAPKLTFAPAHPHRVLDQVLDMVEYQCERTGVKVSKSYDERVTEILLDEKRVRQAFLNVVLNALQAMPRGGALLVRTKMRKRREGPGLGRLYVEFRDTGHGIPGECMERLFDPFFTTKEEGTGMGLPIVDSILRSHGGNVNVESAEGKGTTVTLRLPAKPAGFSGQAA